MRRGNIALPDTLRRCRKRRGPGWLWKSPRPPSLDSTRLDTDYLQWNPDIKKIQTDAFVKVYRRGDVATGWGLEANQTLTRIKILNQVSGTMKDAGSYEDKNTK